MPDVPSQRIVLARHTTPTGEIQLQQRPLADGTPAFEIIVDGVFLMASYNQAGERALARYALDALPSQAQSDLRVRWLAVKYLWDTGAQQVLFAIFNLVNLWYTLTRDSLLFVGGKGDTYDYNCGHRHADCSFAGDT